MARVQGTRQSRNNLTPNHRVTPSTTGPSTPIPEDHQIQPGHDISRIERPEPARPPVTPARTFRIDQKRGYCTSQCSPDGGIPLTQPYRLQTPTSVPLWSPPDAASYSANSANVGRRRARHGTMLLKSPARPGHSCRMKQIFENANNETICPRDNGVALYPQLPNISRAASPQKRDPQRRTLPEGTAANSPASLLPPMESLPIVSESTQACEPLVLSSERSSESWSNDSGYINLYSHSQRGSAATGSPRHRIFAWLSTVSETDDDCARAPFAKVSGNSDQSIEALPRRIVKSSVAVIQTKSPRVTHRQSSEHNFVHIHRESGDNPFVTDISNSSKSSIGLTPIATESFHLASKFAPAHRHISEVCQRLNFNQSVSAMTHDDPRHSTPQTPLALDRVCPKSLDTTQGADSGGIQLSPLSPNVCVERGPSRYHTSRSPTKSSMHDVFATPLRFLSGRAKENTAMAEHLSRKADSVRTLNSARKKTTKVWHPPEPAISAAGQQGLRRGIGHDSRIG